MIFSLMLFLALDTTVHLDKSTSVPDVDQIAINEDISLWLDSNVGHITDDLRKLNELVELIFSKDSLNLVYDNSRTKTAIETFQERNGNCLSFTNLFVGMARHLGMNAYFQEVVNFPTWDRHGEVVVLNRHINVVVRINNKSYTMDFNPNSDRREQFTRIINDKRARAQYYNNLGAEWFQQGEPDRAVAHFHKALSIDDGVSFTWSNLGVALVAQKDFNGAEQAYLEALRNNRKEYTAMSNLVRLYERTDQADKAKRFRSKAQRFRNRNPYYHFMMAENAYSDGDYQKAIRHYKDAIRRKDKVHEFHFGLARAYAEAGMDEKVGPELVMAMRYAPDVFDQTRYSQKLESYAKK